MPMAPEPLTRAQRVLLAVLAAVAAIARFAALSKGPWDWDEVLFCLGVREYDVSAHWPHPPGFPLYIALGKLARLIAPSDFTALQSINVLAGFLVLPVVFWLARSLRFPFAPSLVAATIVAFLPNVWFFGGTAFSDVPAMVLFLAAAAAYFGAEGNAKRYVLASILFAAGMLIRPQNALVMVFPWTIATMSFVRAKRWRVVIAGTMLVALLVIAGYGAAAYLTGFESYFAALRGHSAYVRNADTAANPWRAPLWQVLLIQLDPYHAGKVSLLVNLLALAGIIRGTRDTVVRILLTFVPFYLFAAVVVNPLGSSRFSLNYITWIILLATMGMFALADLVPRARLPIVIVLSAVIVGRFIQWVLPAFENPRHTDAPPVLAAKWIAQNVPKDTTVFMDESIWPWAMYYLHDYELVHVYRQEEIVRNPRARDGWYLHMNGSQLEGARTFIRERDRIWNIVTQRAFEATVIPSAGLAAFTEGWYEPEGDIVQWRWSKRRSKIELPPIGGNCELRLVFSLPTRKLHRAMSVTFVWNGQRVGTYTTRAADNELTLHLKSREDRPNELRILPHEPFVPRKLGIGDDARELGIQFHGWRWRRL